MPQAEQRQQVERVLDVALYAPLGLALTVRDRLPRQLKQRRQALENRVQLARFVGELAVRYGKAELQRELAERQAAQREGAIETTADSSTAASAAQVETVAVDQTADSTAMPADEPAETAVPVAASLPIGDYESLAAIHVVERLASLRADEIEQIRLFESAHRARRTILAKVGQLQDAAAS